MIIIKNNNNHNNNHHHPNKKNYETMKTVHKHKSTTATINNMLSRHSTRTSTPKQENYETSALSSRLLHSLEANVCTPKKPL
jgi:hypothetical protein